MASSAGSAAPRAGVPRWRPAEQLRRYVAGYVDFDMAGWPAGRHRGLPDGTLALVVSLGPPPMVRRPDHADLRAVATVAGPDPPPTIWPSVPYPDPQAAIDFLVATFGFEPTALIPGDQPGSYAEIELRWPHGSGGIIIRSWDRPAPNWLYVVTPDPDGLYARVKAACLEITREIEDTDYGSRTFTVVDPWSVSWSFGTYPGS